MLYSRTPMYQNDDAADYAPSGRLLRVTVICSHVEVIYMIFQKLESHYST